MDIEMTDPEYIAEHVEQYEIGELMLMAALRDDRDAVLELEVQLVNITSPQEIEPVFQLICQSWIDTYALVWQQITGIKADALSGFIAVNAFEGQESDVDKLKPEVRWAMRLMMARIKMDAEQFFALWFGMVNHLDKTLIVRHLSALLMIISFNIRALIEDEEQHDH